MLILLCFYSKIDLKLWNFQKIRSKIAREAKYGNIWQYTSVFGPKFEHAQETAQSTAKKQQYASKNVTKPPKDTKKLSCKAKITIKKHQNRQNVSI